MTRNGKRRNCNEKRDYVTDKEGRRITSGRKQRKKRKERTMTKRRIRGGANDEGRNKELKAVMTIFLEIKIKKST